MDLHCDCNDIPASEQPSGKISKTAFKLFGKRKSGSTMPSIFGVKNKGDGKGSAKMGLVRSKTHDGIADMGLEAGNMEASLSNYHLETDSGLKIVSSVSFATGGCGTVAKSHSFFSLLRKSSKLENGKGEANSEQVRDKSCNRQKKGLKGLFSSMRWHKKEKVTKGEKAEFLEIHCGTLLLPGSLTASLECVKEEMQKSSSEPQITSSESQGKSCVPCETLNGDENVSQAEPGQADCGKSHPELCGVEDSGRDTKDGLSLGQAGEEETGTASEVEQVNWDEALNGKRQEPPEKMLSPTESELGKPSQSAEHSGPANLPPAEQSIDRICLMFSDVTSLKSFDSLTGCGDIIADQDDEGNSCERGAVGEKGKSVSRKNSNVLTYQGGGEEMASPEEVDDEYLQEFWDTPPPTAEPLKEKQQQIGPAWSPSKDTVCFAEAANSTLPKLLALNEISVSNSDNDGLNSTKNDQQEGVPNSDEGYWDSTTPGPDDESGKTLVTRDSIPRDSYSGDALYDLFADPDESLTGIVSDEEMSSLSEPKALPPKTLLPVFNASVVPKDRNVSAIPKQKGSLSVCQENANNTPLPHKPQQLVGCEPTRTKIPVAKTSIPRPTNKVTTGASVRSSIAYGRSRK